jgi:hypothetical protein
LSSSALWKEEPSVGEREVVASEQRRDHEAMTAEMADRKRSREQWIKGGKRVQRLS